MNNTSLKIQVENTTDALKDNLNMLHIETTKHESCLLAIQSLLNYEYEETKQIIDDLTTILQNQAEDINALTGFVANQIENINNNN